jgi:hypothetical protein
MLVAVYGVIEGLASVAALFRRPLLCARRWVIHHALRAHRDPRRFRITEVELFTLTSTAMRLIAEVYLKLPEPDQLTLSLLLYRKAQILAALITAFSGAQLTPNMGR